MKVRFLITIAILAHSGVSETNSGSPNFRAAKNRLRKVEQQIQYGVEQIKNNAVEGSPFNGPAVAAYLDNITPGVLNIINTTIAMASAQVLTPAAAAYNFFQIQTILVTGRPTLNPLIAKLPPLTQLIVNTLFAQTQTEMIIGSNYVLLELQSIPSQWKQFVAQLLHLEANLILGSSDIVYNAFLAVQGFRSYNPALQAANKINATISAVGAVAVGLIDGLRASSMNMTLTWDQWDSVFEEITAIMAQLDLTLDAQFGSLPSPFDQKVENTFQNVAIGLIDDSYNALLLLEGLLSN